MDAVQGKLERFHPVQSTQIIFTPDHGQAEDLVEDGTYARCGNKGQPYLLWNQNIPSYRIQVWGFELKTQNGNGTGMQQSLNLPDGSINS